MTGKRFNQTLSWINSTVFLSAVVLGLSGTKAFGDACCLPQDRTCLEMPHEDCQMHNGVPLGPNTACLGDENNNGIDDACERYVVLCETN